MDRRDELDHLLSRGRLGAPRRERIFEKVDRAVRGRLGRARYWLVGGPLALAALLAIALRPERPDRDQYAAKGGGHSTVELGCSEGELSHCPRGSKLVFLFDDVGRPVYLHAYAEPLAAGGERIWYYPTAAHAPPLVVTSGATRTLDQGVVIGAEHAPGAYRVHILLASAPLSREQVREPAAPNVVAVETVDLVVTP